nr:organic cation transporter protein-like [Penaeus vannamei]
MFGVTIGAPFNGVLADRYGRKMTMAVGFVAYSALAIGSCWIPNLSALLLSRFLMGAVDPTILKTGYILGMEVADPKWRTHIGIALFLPWALSLMAWGGFAYLVREWRMLQLTVSLLCLAFLPTLWFMDESPRWLAVRGQHRRALRVLQRAARWNGVALPPRTSFCSCSRTESRTRQWYARTKTPAPHRESWFRRRLDEAFILFRTPRLRTITLSLYTNYLLVGAVYFGLSLSGGDLSSDPFLYMVLTGVVELPAYTLVIPLVARYGRRAPVVAFFFMGAVALLALPFVPTGSGESMTLALMGR